MEWIALAKLIGFLAVIGGITYILLSGSFDDEL